MLFLLETGGRKLILNVDNARSHPTGKCRMFCAENELRVSTDPPDSPHLAPSDFFLFGDVRKRREGFIFPSHPALLIGLGQVRYEIPAETLQWVFAHRMMRLEWVSQNNGNSCLWAHDSLISFSDCHSGTEMLHLQWNILDIHPITVF
jgi:hypothetical protein